MDTRSPPFLESEKNQEFFDNSPYSVVSDLPEYNEQEDLVIPTHHQTHLGMFSQPSPALYDYSNPRMVYREDRSTPSSAGLSDGFHSRRSSVSSNGASPYISPRMELATSEPSTSALHPPIQLMIPELERPQISDASGPRMNLIPATPLSALEGKNAVNISLFKRDATVDPQQQNQFAPSQINGEPNLLVHSYEPPLSRRRSDADLPSQTFNHTWDTARKNSVDDSGLGPRNPYNPQNSPFHNNTLPLLPSHPPPPNAYALPSVSLNPAHYLSPPASARRRRSEGHRSNRSADALQTNYLDLYPVENNSGPGHVRRSSAGSDGRPSPYVSPLREPVPLVNEEEYYDRYTMSPAYLDTNNVGSEAAPSGSDDGHDSSDVARQVVTTGRTKMASIERRKREATFKCDVPGCGSTFTRKFNLKGHLRSHNEERPFVCKWPGCNKGFARQHDCKRHEQLHSNYRPFQCHGCDKPFARMDALNRHLRSEGGSECNQKHQAFEKAAMVPAEPALHQPHLIADTSNWIE